MTLATPTPASFDDRRCVTCGCVWSEHTADCPRHEFRPSIAEADADLARRERKQTGDEEETAALRLERLRILAASRGPWPLQIVDVLAVQWVLTELDRLLARIARFEEDPRHEFRPGVPAAGRHGPQEPAREAADPDPDKSHLDEREPVSGQARALPGGLPITEADILAAHRRVDLLVRSHAGFDPSTAAIAEHLAQIDDVE